VNTDYRKVRKPSFRFSKQVATASVLAAILTDRHWQPPPPPAELMTSLCSWVAMLNASVAMRSHASFAMRSQAVLQVGANMATNADVVSA
jgi:hypothetical protein